MAHDNASVISRTHASSNAGPKHQELSTSLLRITDFGLLAVVFFAPFFMGGRHPFGQLVFAGIAYVTAIAWMLRTCIQSDHTWRFSAADGVCLLAILLVLLQLAPLPPNWLAAISPQLRELLPLWSHDQASAASFPAWNRITLTPESTWSSLSLLVAYGLLFRVVVLRIQSLHDIERLLRWIAIAVVLMGTIGLLQLLLGTEKFLWLYKHPSRIASFPVKGMFSNPNHFAHFLALGVGPLIWLLCQLESTRKKRNTFRVSSKRSRNTWSELNGPALVAAAGIVGFAGLLSFSRGGVIVLFLAASSCITTYWFASLVGKRSLLALAAVGAIVGTALLAYGYQPLVTEMGSLQAESAEQLGQHMNRLAIWRADLQAVQAFPWLGTGVGSHRDVYPTFFSEFSEVEYSHAESGFLQVLMETGVAGFLLLLAGIVISAVWVVRGLRSETTRSRACAGAIGASLLVSVLHSVFDFVWYIPACMSLTVILLGCACRLSQLSDGRQHSGFSFHPPSGLRFVATAAVTLAAIALLVNDLPRAMGGVHWDRYLRVALNQPDPLEMTYDDHIQQQQTVDQLIGHLDQVLENDPHDARANLRLSQLHLTRFEVKQRMAVNPMPLAHIRDAAIASRFPSRHKLNKWLDVAVGDHRAELDLALTHVRRALRHCPMHGEAYALLAELAFLEGQGEQAKQRYVSQAVKLRPHSGLVLLAAGSEAALQNDSEQALKFWRRAFHQDPGVRGKLLELLTPQFSPDFFVQQFAPNTNELRGLYHQYRRIGREDQAGLISRQLVDALVREAQEARGDAAATMWWHAHTILVQEGQFGPATVCGRNAVQMAPIDFSYRRGFADFLMQQESYTEAIQHLQWCLRRANGDRRLQDSLDLAIEQSSRTAPVSEVPRASEIVR